MTRTPLVPLALLLAAPAAADPGRADRLRALALDRSPAAALRADPAAPPPAPDQPLDAQLANLRAAVARGDWPAVDAYLAALPPADAAAGYDALLRGLKANRPVLTADDAAGVVACAPGGVTPDRVPALAALLKDAVAAGTLPDQLADRLSAEAAKPGGEGSVTRRQAARLLADAGLAAHAGDLLPALNEAVATKDADALELLIMVHLARHDAGQPGHLDTAWVAARAAADLSADEASVTRAADLAARVDPAAGRAWLAGCFADPARGRLVLAAAGAAVARGLADKPQDTAARLASVRLAVAAADAALGSGPDAPVRWKVALTALAAAWLREAEYTRDNDPTGGPDPGVRRDKYGNVYYTEVATEFDRYGRPLPPKEDPKKPKPIPVRDLLTAAPSAGWLSAVADALRPTVQTVLARLRIKAGHEPEAFALIEALAAAHADTARALVKDFLSAWAKAHDLRTKLDAQRKSQFYFGYETRADGIPLTRSQQERNLRDLSDLAARARKLPGGAGDIGDDAWVAAFTTCHSPAEVYRADAVAAVFGPPESLAPRTAASLVQRMREDLAGTWRKQGTQEKQKTNRKPKEVEAEVLRGYQVAAWLADDALGRHPADWALLAAKAAVRHDELNYRKEVAGPTETHLPARSECLALFRRAADEYVKAAAGLPAEARTTQVFDQWFAASLGAIDLKALADTDQPDARQPALIRAALEALPGDVGEDHRGRFAGALFGNLSAVKPAVKVGYLRAGFEVVGDHPRAAEAKRLFDYYKDLVTEVKFEASVDGPTRVGHGRPFGVRVNVRHTADVEREAGGFGRYLQNQTQTNSYSYNYGRPQADYRDRFETAAREALGDKFEVASVTFQADKVQSRPAPEAGWRLTPYAYLVLKAKGPEVDTLPPLKLDLDFLDPAGYAVLPVATRPIPLDCRDAAGDARPVPDLSVTQTLDDRAGALKLEVKATAAGIMPPLDELWSGPPAGFAVDGIEDRGAAITGFAGPDSAAVKGERAWLVTLRPEGGASRVFRFPGVKLPMREVVLQRYAGLDLVPTGPEVELAGEVVGGRSRWPWVVGAGLLLAAAAAVMLTQRRTAVEAVANGIVDATPAGVLGQLSRALAGGRLTQAETVEAATAKAAIERHYYAGRAFGEPPPDLDALAGRWGRAAGATT